LAGGKKKEKREHQWLGPYNVEGEASRHCQHLLELATQVFTRETPHGGDAAGSQAAAVGFTVHSLKPPFSSLFFS
jgi:hypothetical protein